MGETGRRVRVGFRRFTGETANNSVPRSTVVHRFESQARSEFKSESRWSRMALEDAEASRVQCV
eukprot:5292739-Prymnesium_polylepis.1